MAKITRRRGLTEEDHVHDWHMVQEKQCMRRPIPSEEILLKAQKRRKNSNCDKMIELCQSESEALGPRFECDTKAEKPWKDPVQEYVPNFLRSEQHLADVIQRILPAEKFKCSNSNFRCGTGDAGLPCDC
eukprot:s1874_g22.t1